MSTPNDDIDFGQTIRGFAEGQKVFGRYTLRHILGRGGMGIVWLAEDEKLDRSIALKFLPDIVTSDPVAIDDLKRETLRCLELTHPGIVRIHDFLDNGTHSAISMEYVEGLTLSAWRIEKANRVFEVAEAQPWITTICEAIEYAHSRARVVHRDLKPSNIMLTAKGEIKVADFGIARSISDSVSRVSVPSAATSGTLVYMSPQQLTGKAPSALDDVYSLGATFYELLTGKPPFYNGNIHHQIENIIPPSMADRRAELQVEGTKPIPEHWEQVVAACLAKDAQLRPQSVAEIADRLAGKTRPAHLPEPVQVKKPSPDRRLIAAGIALALVVIGLAMWIAGKNDSKTISPITALVAGNAAPVDPGMDPENSAREKLAAAERQKAEAEEAGRKLEAKRRDEQQAALEEQSRLAEARSALTAQTLAAAQEARQAGDWGRAETLIGNVLALDPSNAAAHQLRGEIKVAKQMPAITATPAPNPMAPSAPTLRETADVRWIFPDSSNRYLQPGELAGMDKETLWRARNEIYVRRGYIFATERGQKFARSFGAAYTPKISGEEAISRVFNAFETANVDRIKNYENAR